MPFRSRSIVSGPCPLRAPAYRGLPPLAILAAAGLMWAAATATEAAIIAPPLKIAAPELYQAREPDQKSAEEPPTKIEELDQAVESFKKGEYDQCLSLLEGARKKHPELPPARLILARLFFSSNQVQEGRQILEQVAAEAPGYPGLYLDFGNLDLSEGRVSDASLNFEKAVTLAEAGKWTEELKRGFSIRAHAGLASVAELRKDWSAAESQLSAWLEIDPKNGKARQRLGRALFALDKQTEAYEQLQQAVKDDPTLEPAAVTVGWLHTQAGNLEKAGEWMEYAVEVAPEDPQTHQAMVTWLLQQGKPEEAKTHAEAAAKLAPDSRQIKLLLGLVARHLKDYAQAEQYFNAICQQSPADFEASNQLALALVEQSDEAKRRRALELAQMNARLYPDASEPLSTLGRVYHRMGRLEEAEQALRAAVSGGTPRPDTAYYLAQVMSDRGQPEDASRWLRAALDTSGRFTFRSEAQDWLGQISKESQ